ncbi:MAG TPA: hypothetical protein VGZ27_20130 [Vicinamibacterales bacterium]|jgi:hypothetical protein|nr:hypothetical protein [Vicinamibacterales bacterium]
MIGHSPGSRRLILGLVLLASYAYFYEAGGWNQNSRFDLVRAILQRHTLQIDAFHENTGDKATYNGHVYSDKAPGLALTAVPVVAAATVALRSIGVDPKSERGIVALTYTATVALDGVAIAAAAVGLSLIALWLFGNESGATFAALSFGLATPAWAFATLFFGHALATACLLLAFGAAVALPTLTVTPARVRCAFLVGIAAGWGTVTEYTVAVPAALIAALVVANERLAKRDDWLAVLGALFAGAIICATVLAAFNAAAFGSPFSLGYAVANSPLGELHVGVFGLTYPKPAIIGELLVGAYRGLLPLAPVLALAPVGFWVWYRTAADRKPLAVAAIIPVYYLLLNSSYFYWEGGWSYGPRHMLPALPFLALALAPLWNAAGRPARFGLAAICACGIGITLIAVSVTPQPPSLFDHPFRQLWWPAFLEGDVSVNQESFETYGWNPELFRNHPEVHQAWNLGERIGLRGRTSLVPLLAVWMLGAAWWVRAP